jgi:RimJ/RimL family protein N-acetyltransferase
VCGATISRAENYDVRSRDLERPGDQPGNRDVHFTIYDLDDLAPVGTALLVRGDQHAGTAEFGLTIGERRNQGLGAEATRLVLDWAFTVMGLHNILLVTFSWNLLAIRAYSKAGFPGDRQAARSRRHLRPASPPGAHGCSGQ